MVFPILQCRKLAREFIELAGKINQNMPYFCVEKIEQALNNHSKAVRGSRILLLGVSYKPGVGDIRESPALKILKLLGKQGAELSYHDPHVPLLVESGLESSALDPELESADLVVIVTAHPEIDYRRVVDRSASSCSVSASSRASRSVMSAMRLRRG